MDIKIKYLRDIEKIEPMPNGDMIDLRVAEDVKMKKGEFKLIPLGVAMKIPDGYYARVVPRSSTFKKWGILQANSVGIIDNSYCGDEDEWMFPALAMNAVYIPKNTRICQFEIVKKQPEISFEEVETLGNENRGGFGSTGEISWVEGRGKRSKVKMEK